jgi:hypothetical protein
MAALGIALSIPIPAHAQLANTTALIGTVVDSGGASVAGVTIKAVNQGTQDTYNVVTGSTGDYVIQFIKAGRYNVTATLSGFSSLTQEGLEIDTNQTVRANFTLQVGKVTQNIVVTAEAPAISTDNAAAKETVSSKAVVELPLNGRNVLQIATSTPGLLPGLKSSTGVPPGEGYIAAGTREIQNSVSLDGISIMNNLIMTTPYHPSPDAVQQLDVQTGTYTAQYGGYLGAHLDLVSRSGSNEFHGALFEFFRNDKLNARNYFSSPAQQKPSVRQNQFGLVVSGPVLIPKLYNGRNRTFFMFDYEALRGVTQAAGVTSVLNDRMRSGDFSQLLPGTPLRNPAGGTFAGNILPASRISPQALRVLNYMSRATSTAVTNNLVGTSPNNDNFNQTIGRLDQNLGDKTRLFFRYAWQDETFFNNTTPNFSGSISVPVETKNWVVGWTQTLTHNMVNDIRFGHQSLTTNSLNYWYVNGLNSAGTDLGIPGFTADTTANMPGIPVFTITNYVTLGRADTNWFQTDSTWHGTDSFTWTHGAHTVIAGVEFRKLITGRLAVNNAQGLFNFDGTYTGNAAADFMLGYVANNTTPTPQVRNIVAQWRDGFFVTDNWRATRRLTLDLGLRYELPTVPYTKNGFATMLNAAQTALIPPNPPVPGFGFINPNHKNFAPRFGGAYRITEKTVFRAGYGIYFNPNQNNTFTFLSANPPFVSTVTYNGNRTTPDLTLSTPFIGTPGAIAPPNIITPNRNLPTAYMHQWSASLERGIWTGGALELSYLGSRSLHLDRSYFNNRPNPGAGNIQTRRPNQLFGDIRTIQNDEVATYNGLSFIYRQRLYRGFQTLASYTWSHTTDVGTDSNGGGAPMDPYNWRGDYGNSNWDVRHRFVMNFNYELPFFRDTTNLFLRGVLGGWQANGIITLQSGFPFNVIMGGDNSNTGNSNQRPNVIAPTRASCDGSDPRVNCVDVSAFQQPARYTYGNAGRNILLGPGIKTVNFSAFKNFAFKERFNVQFRAEMFNLFNTPVFNLPNATLPLLSTGNTYNASNIANFGTITSTRLDNRQIQFGLKFLF